MLFGVVKVQSPEINFIDITPNYNSKLWNVTIYHRGPIIWTFPAINLDIFQLPN